MDPLLHMGVVIRCAAGWNNKISNPNNIINEVYILAYTGLYSDDELDKNCTFHSASVAAPNNGHRSLADYVEQVQRAHRGSILDLTVGFLLVFTQSNNLDI
jgi:hypothetical protein